MTNNTSSTKKVAIITGASSGLGSEFALQIEKKAFLDEIWLIARRAEPMAELAQKFRKAKAVILPLDLTIPAELEKISSRIEKEKPEIQYLVNNAGYGKIGEFSEIELQDQLKMIDLNIRSLTHLTHLCLPYANKGSTIIQVASSIGYCPAPYFAVYAATKAYVVSFSQALREELKPKNIQVIAVCPGPVATEFFSVAQKINPSTSPSLNPRPINDSLSATAEEVVKKALLDADRGRATSVFGLAIQLFVTFIPFVPHTLKMKAMAKRNR